MRKLDEENLLALPNGEELGFPDWVIYIVIPLAGSMFLPLAAMTVLLMMFLLLFHIVAQLAYYWFDSAKEAFREMRA